MSNNKEKIIDYIWSKNKCFCDDCLSKLLDIKPRQTINAICNEAAENKLIDRYKGSCSICHNTKLINCTIKDIPPVKQNISSKEKSLMEEPVEYKVSNRLTPDEFERRVGQYLQKTYGQEFKEKALIVGENKVHNFDSVSQDNLIVVECKSYTWTKTDNVPSAKISTAVEAIFYLSRITANKKIIAFQDSLNKNNRSLVDYLIKNYGGLMDDVEVWSYIVGETIADDYIEVKREKGSVWYQTMYK